MSPAEHTSEAVTEDRRNALDSLTSLPRGGVCLILGSPDRGTRSFTLHAAASLMDDDAKTALIDANISNSELGLPGTVAVAWASPQLDRLQDMTPAAEYFVGSFSANSVALEFTSAVACAVMWARSHDAARILVELPLPTSTAAGRRLMAAFVQSVVPDRLTVFCEPNELEDILAIAAVMCPSVTVLRIGTPAAIPQISQAQQRLLQGARLYRAFGKGQELRLPLGRRDGDGIYTLNTTLGTSELLQPHLVRWISQTLRRRVIRAEMIPGRQLDLYVQDSAQRDRSGSDIDQAIVAEHFNLQTIRQIPLNRLIDSYVGLIDDSGKLVGVGRFAGLDETTQDIRIASAVSSSHRIRIVQFGKARVAANGSPIDDESYKS